MIGLSNHALSLAATRPLVVFLDARPTSMCFVLGLSTNTLSFSSGAFIGVKVTKTVPKIVSKPSPNLFRMWGSNRYQRNSQLARLQLERAASRTYIDDLPSFRFPSILSTGRRGVSETLTVVEMA